MAVDKPVPVPEQQITSIDILGFQGGLNLNGAAVAPPNSFIDCKDIELTVDGCIVPRRTLQPFLPDTVETTYQKLPVLWNNNIYYFTADNGKIRYCKATDTAWSDCTGSNTITTNNGGMTELLRVLDKVLILNGRNGDKLAYVDLATSGFPVTKYTAVADPTVAPTATLTNLAAGSFNIYYAYAYNGAIGETNLSPILTQSINIVRDQWATQTSKGSIKISRPAGAAPTGAESWNLYIALAPTSGSIQATDMLLIAAKLDLNTHDFVDDGTLDIILGQNAPTANSTDGPRVSHGIVEDGNPILFDDVDNPEDIWIGGGGIYALDFSVNNGGYKAQPELGTNFRVTAIIGFRNGQGIPSLTVLFSNTEGLAKQSVLEQDTVNYGNQSFTVWGVKEQHYGAAGVAATSSLINYNGKLLFLSTDGFMSMNTQPLRQNVISTDAISVKQIDKYVRTIKNSAMNTVIGAGWDQKFMWLVPNDGFDTPQQILISDDNNNGAWYTLNIPAQWIGVVSPADDPAFVYVCQGTKSYKLLPGLSTFDLKNGVPQPFSTGATGPLVSMGGPAHNHWQADVQAVFYFTDVIGDLTVGVTYKNLNGKPKTKTKTFHGPKYTPTTAGGWGDPQWTYANFPQIQGWSGTPALDPTKAAVTAQDARIAIPVDDITNESQWFYSTPSDYCNYKLVRISFEGINLGVRPDLQ